MKDAALGAICAVAVAGATFMAARAGVAGYGWDGDIGGFLFFVHFTFGLFPLALLPLLWFPLRSRPALRRGYAICGAVIAAVFVTMIFTMSLGFKA